VVAVDWSGARAPAAQRAGICVAIARADGIDGVEASAGRTRDETIEVIEQLPAPAVVGFDFSFGVPEWFARAEGSDTIDDVWALAARDGDVWLRPTPPFWRDHCAVAPEQRFRRCELELAPAKSIFQLVGNGQVGAGSVRGMPLLARIRAQGFAIWPFDPPGPRTALEIYPSRLRRFHSTPLWPTYSSEHERDAVESARVMWEHRASFSRLRAATDPVTRIEGDVWMPDLVPE
jgi:Protein of unknown function (DUF429)